MNSQEIAMTLRRAPAPALFAAMAASLALAACGASEHAGADGGAESAPQSEAAACAGEGVAVSGAWARSARAGQPATAAYMVLCSETGDALLSARFDGADATELHVTSMSEGGRASMTRAEKIALPAGEAVALEPGGAHVMMIGVNEALPAGGAATLTLEFERAGTVDVALEVREATAAHGR